MPGVESIACNGFVCCLPQVEEYGSPATGGRPPSAQLEIVDLDSEPLGEEAKTAALDQRVSLRECFLRRRVQGYAPAEPAAFGDAKDALKEAYFGLAAPPAFDFQIDGVDLEREMAASEQEAAEAAEALERQQRAMNNRKRFLQRRVQGYV